MKGNHRYHYAIEWQRDEPKGRWSIAFYRRYLTEARVARRVTLRLLPGVTVRIWNRVTGEVVRP